MGREEREKEEDEDEDEHETEWEARCGEARRPVREDAASTAGIGAGAGSDGHIVVSSSCC